MNTKFLLNGEWKEGRFSASGHTFAGRTLGVGDSITLLYGPELMQESRTLRPADRRPFSWRVLCLGALLCSRVLILAARSI